MIQPLCNNRLSESFQCHSLSLSGQYICNATNAAGFSEAYVQLEVDCE